MHRLLIILTAIAFWQVTPALSDDEALVAEFEAARDTLNQAFEDQDGAAIASMMTADHVGVTSVAGVQTTAEQVATIDDWNARYFDYSTPSVTVLAPDVVQITYENSYEGNYAGTPLPARVFVSQIWLKQDGTWKQQLYQETPIDSDK